MVVDVTDAASASNTRRALTYRVGNAFSKYLPVSRFELGWCRETDIASAEAVVFRKGPDVRESTRDLRGTGIARILQAGKPERVPTSTGEDLVLPLVDSEGARGYACVSFAATPDQAYLSEPVLGMLGRMLSFAQGHCRLVERIAKLSSAAQHESQDLRQELRRYTEADGIVSRSESMRKALESADLVARHDTAVLLRGESGTGKELVARRIHRLSRRARQPFVSVNCGALPETLIESELFGHERGAFTGAAGRYRGRFERANNGTIFLDEIAELPPSAQVKLLRVLQEGEFERLGGEETIRVNVRVLAATHRPLEAMTEEGKFRTDLFYRINVFPIVLPALRERPEDIPVLARTLLASMSKRLGIPIPPLHARGIAKLVDYSWPGNVRELANALERALIVAQGRELDFHDLPGNSPSVVSKAGDTAETFNDGARRTIQRALEASGGRIYGAQGAAARLGIPPSTLQGKMQKLGMKRTSQ